MFKDNHLNALFGLLEEMTLTKRVNPGSIPSQRMRRIENFLLGAITTTLITMVVLALWYRYIATSSNQDATPILILGAYFIMLFFDLAYLTTVCINLIQALRRHKRKFSAILGNFKNDLHIDANFLTRLWAFDRKTLQYGLLQYRHQWGIFDGRQQALSGDVRKLGLFPALATASITASTLLKTDSILALWIPLILACCFYIVSFYAITQRERPEQVIALLEYAIEHVNSSDKRNA